jgi:NADH:ubiquinone oxidoreductase subunit 6 (subunit J)
MIPLLILTPLILLAALGAVWLARPVHAALLLALTLALIAVFYLTVGAEFIGLVQFMVYVGGVAILIVFSLLITRPGDEAEEVARRPRSVALGVACVAPVLGMLLYAFSKGLPTVAESAETKPPTVPVKDLGVELFTSGVPAVLAIAVLLTAVLIGAALFAREPNKSPRTPAKQ